MTAAVSIVATGARTPLGLHAAPSAAAYRAGMSGVHEHPFMIDRTGDPMLGALDPHLDSALMGSERLVALAETAVREACAPLSGDARQRLQLPVYLGLAELRPGFTSHDADVVRSRIEAFKGLPVEISEVNIATHGHASGLAALASATERIQHGEIGACLVGGVDSYFEPDTMEWLDQNRQLVSALSRSAFVPGEGAGFCLLMGERVRQSLGLAALADVAAVAIGREEKLIKTSEICLGVGLTSVVERTLAGLPPDAEPISAIVCDLNGERYRGEEWGFVCLRLSHYFEDPTGYDSPADSWGDTGAASGPLFAMLACQASARGYAKGPRTLLWASSESGLRGAALLEVKVEG